MKVRLLTSLGILVFGLPLLLLSAYIVYPIALGVLSLIASWELLRVFGMCKKYAVSVPALAIAAAVPFFSSHEFVEADKQTEYILIMALVFFAFLTQIKPPFFCSSMFFANIY